MGELKSSFIAAYNPFSKSDTLMLLSLDDFNCSKQPNLYLICQNLLKQLLVRRSKKIECASIMRLQDKKPNSHGRIGTF